MMSGYVLDLGGGGVDEELVSRERGTHLWEMVFWRQDVGSHRVS